MTISSLRSLRWHADELDGVNTKYLRLDELRAAATEFHVLESDGEGDCYLAIEVRDGLHVTAVLASWSMSDESDGTEGIPIEARTFVRRIFIMDGPSANLRELRHTYFGSPGDDGYIFYAPIFAIAMAAPILARFFDSCGPPSEP